MFPASSVLFGREHRNSWSNLGPTHRHEIRYITNLAECTKQYKFYELKYYLRTNVENKTCSVVSENNLISVNAFRFPNHLHDFTFLPHSSFHNVREIKTR